MAVSSTQCAARPAPLDMAIAALPEADYARLQPDLDLILMPLGWAVYESGCRRITGADRPPLLQALVALRRATKGTTELNFAAAARRSCAIFRNFFLRPVLNEAV